MKGKPWHKALFVIGIILLFIFIAISVVLWSAQHDKSNSYRDSWVKWLLLGANVDRHETKLEDMKTGEWNTISCPADFTSKPINGDQDMTIPVMIMSQKDKSKPPLNFLKLADPVPKNIVFFHGGQYSCQSYYKEMQEIRDYLNMNIIMVEYPGFGFRKDFCRATEYNFMEIYPKEVDYILNRHLKIDWKDCIVWGNCFGGPIYLRCLWYMNRVRENNIPAAFFFSKPFISIRLTAKTFTKFEYLGLITPSNMFSLLPFNKSEQVDKWVEESINSITCPVFMLVCELDNVSPPNQSKKLLEKFVNAKYRKLTFLQGEKHQIDMLQVIQKQIQSFI